MVSFPFISVQRMKRSWSQGSSANIKSVKGYWQPKFLLCYLKVLTHLRMNMVLIPRQSLLFKSYSYLNSPKF